MKPPDAEHTDARGEKQTEGGREMGIETKKREAECVKWRWTERSRSERALSSSREKRKCTELEGKWES